MISGKKFLAAVVSGSCVGKSSFISGHTGLRGHKGVMTSSSTVIPVIEIDLGLLLASMAMCLVLCRARKDNNVRRYGYQPGKSDRTFA